MQKSLFLFFVVSFFAVTSCNTQKNASQSSDKDTFIHTVYFWYNDGVTAEEIKAFEASMVNLAKVPLISKAFYGPPALTPRDVVDNSYDYAWINHFKSKAEHDLYQKDATHLAMIEKHKHMWKRVQVYDTVVGR